MVGRGLELEGVGQALRQFLHHRGPDSSGVSYLEGAEGDSVGLFAHTRLKIIDLSDVAAQPFSDQSGLVNLTFNGEIYNFRYLREKLVSDGYSFRSQSDTEVVLAQYLEHGLKGLEQLDGMFAFAIWDKRQNQLILMRDRVGKKPLYWTQFSNGYAFASEAKALEAIPGIKLSLDPERIPEYLIYGYVPTPNTIFRNINRLEPGVQMVCPLDSKPSFRPYWSLLESIKEPISTDVETAKQMVRGAVGRAVSRRLVADVPVGAFLSGGVDSSIVVAEMVNRSSSPVRTFAVGFDDDQTYDETKYASIVSKKLGTQHTELRVKPNPEELFERLLYHHDEPYGDSSALAVHAVAAATREYVKVVLTGDGGDEVFAGYSRFKGGLIKERVPDGMSRTIKNVVDRFPEPRGYKHPLSLIRRFVEHAGRSQDEQLLAWNAYFAGPMLQELLRPDVYGLFDPWQPMKQQLSVLHNAKTSGIDRLGQILYHNFHTYLLDDLLVKTDRMTMAHGLEARSPFLDTDLIELIFRLPSSMKILGGQLKWLLKEAYRDVFGPEILDRPKHGFGVPVAKWWSGSLAVLVDELLLGPNPRVAQWLRVDSIRRLVGEHRAGRRDHGQRIFALLQLEIFLRRH